ncbi:MAG: hypothetical protein JXB32_18080 [Deltaproteobacteria bacterium]|nr:hypothetical protein [Deltaproteobacteria bacterium]
MPRIENTVPGWLLLAAAWPAACGDGPGVGPVDVTADAAPDAAPDADAGWDALDTNRRDLPPPADAAVETVALPSVCGDGVLDPGEECDDMNRGNGDGCDWLCRLGDGSFDYPPPDDSVPPITLDDDPVVVVPASEGPDGCTSGGRLDLAWSGSECALAYPVSLPRQAGKVRILDQGGRTLGGPWELPVAWTEPALAIDWADGSFVLFAASGWPVVLAKLDRSGSVVDGPRDLPALGAGTEALHLKDAGWNGSLHLVASDVWSTPEAEGPSRTALEAVSARGDRVGPAVVLDTEVFGTWRARVVPVGTLFAVSDGVRVVMLEPLSAEVRWSGYVGRAEGNYGDIAVTPDGVLLFWLEPSETTDASLDLWVAGFDLAGDLVLPPRITRAGIRGRHSAALHATWGAAGALVVLAATDVPGTFDPCEVRALNADRHGNVRSGEVTVFGPDMCGVSGAGGLAVEADDSGYVLVGVGPYTDRLGREIVFRRLIPS